jgi:hypothetical protein
MGLGMLDLIAGRRTRVGGCAQFNKTTNFALLSLLNAGLLLF